MRPYFDEEDMEDLAEEFRVHMRMVEASHVLDVPTLVAPAQTNLVVTCSSNVVVEFTILDAATGDVLLQDGGNFTSPTAGKLLGTEWPEPSTKEVDVIRINLKRVLLPGKIKRMGLLCYAVGGKKFYADGIYGVKVIRPNGSEYDLWRD